AMIEHLATSTVVRKASRRDLAAAVSQGATAATTVAATMCLAHRAGVRIFATGGIGGVHRSRMENENPRSPDAAASIHHSSFITHHSAFDVSADLLELSRTPGAVVCAGAKSILDLAATLEMLETLGVPVVGFETDTFPAFYLRSSGLPVNA